jgi:tripartite-type tricarboxylate transporter receptor subunit TctC
VLVANPAFPAAGIREFIASVRADPDKYTFASSGTGATGHLVAELFNSMAGIRARHVPYKGSVPAITDLMNGNVTYAFDTLAATAAHVKSGRLKAYGISSARRNDALPEVAPVHESAGLPGFEVVAWIGYLAPAGTLSETRARLAAEVRKAVQAGDLRERYAALGMDPVSSSPEDLGALLKREHERYAAIVKRANIRID